MDVRDSFGFCARIASTFATNTFFGAAIYVNIVETPARLSLTSTSAMVDHFQAHFPRARSMQGNLSRISSVCAALGWYLDKDINRNLLLSLACCMLFNLPWTMFIIMPINNQLMDGEYPKMKGESWVIDMMRRWDRVHFVRTMSSFAAMVCLTTYWIKKSS